MTELCSVGIQTDLRRFTRQKKKKKEKSQREKPGFTLVMRTTVKRTREGYQQKTFDSFRQRQKWNDEVFYSVISLREGINLQLRTINRFGNDRKVCVKCQMLRIAEDREKEDLPE